MKYHRFRRVIVCERCKSEPEEIIVDGFKERNTVDWWIEVYIDHPDGGMRCHTLCPECKPDDPCEFLYNSPES